MEPIVTASLVGAGANLLGGALSNTKHVDATAGASYWYNLLEARRARQEEYRRQKEFAKHGVRWRAADAKAAGMHPLFAFGGNLAGYSPSAAVVSGGDGGFAETDNGMGEAMSRAGQDISRAVAAQETEDQRAERLMRLKVLEAAAEKDFALAAEARSRIPGHSQVGPSFPSDVVTQAYNFPKVEAHPLYKDAVKLTPDEMVSRDALHSGSTAGRDHPGMRQFTFPGGFNALLPATGQGGIPEEIDASMIPLVIGANLQRYGWRWLVDAVNYVTGATPAETRAQDRAIVEWFKEAFKSWQFAR